jgi:glycosyltransferase involved in cell wall biosynthesis
VNLIINYHDPYFELHSTLSPYFADAIAAEAGAKVICFYDNRSSTSVLNLQKKTPFTEWVDLSEWVGDDIYPILYQVDSPIVAELCRYFIDSYRPNKVLFFNEFYLLKYFIDFNLTKIYFVRSLSRPLRQRIIDTFNYSVRGSEALRLESNRHMAEARVIGEADQFITDSLFSHDCLKSIYGFSSKLVHGIVPCEYYSDVPSPDFSLKSAYFLGRLDWQKGIQNLSDPSDFDLHIIGNQILTKGEIDHLPSAKFWGWLEKDQYVEIVKEIPFAIFPHLWESNGLTVQEALVMGKVAIVQSGSGGCESFIKDKENGFLYDFKSESSWEDFLTSIADNYDLEQISRRARLTIDPGGYKNSIKLLAKELV